MKDDAAYNSDSLAYQNIEQGFSTVSQVPAYVIVPERKRYVYTYFKRFFDIILSALALVVLSPVFLITAILIKMDDGGPVIYSQPRAGKDRRTFKMD